jgi:hypothetical protein
MNNPTNLNRLSQELKNILFSARSYYSLILARDMDYYIPPPPLQVYSVFQAFLA